MENESRLAEFVNALIEETLSSVQSTYLDQIDRKLEAHRYASAPLEEIAKEIDDEDVQEAMDEKRFPSARTLSAVRMEIAREEQALLKVVLDQGFPNLIIDHGKINAKLDFSFQNDTNSSTDTKAETKRLTKAQKSKLTAAQLNRAKIQTAQIRKGAGLKINRFSKSKLSANILSRQPQLGVTGLQINVQPKDEKNVSKTDSTSGNAAIDIDLNFKVIY